MNLYTKISDKSIDEILRKFYDKAFQDPIIGYMFEGKDKELLISQQKAFTVGMMGGPKDYKGKSLELAHKALNIRHAHFNRRKVLMREAMDECRLDRLQAEEWLMLEEQFRKLIVQIKEACL